MCHYISTYDSGWTIEGCATVLGLHSKVVCYKYKGQIETSHCWNTWCSIGVLNSWQSSRILPTRKTKSEPNYFLQWINTTGGNLDRSTEVGSTSSVQHFLKAYICSSTIITTYYYIGFDTSSAQTKWVKYRSNDTSATLLEFMFVLKSGYGVSCHQQISEFASYNILQSKAI